MFAWPSCLSALVDESLLPMMCRYLHHSIHLPPQLFWTTAYRLTGKKCNPHLVGAGLLSPSQRTSALEEPRELCACDRCPSCLLAALHPLAHRCVTAW